MSDKIGLIGNEGGELAHDPLIPVVDNAAFGDGVGVRTRKRRIAAGLLEVERINNRLYARESKRREYIGRLLAGAR
jgi:hypothetical protein